MTIYTHGHHESVLRSHRWRTAENSAAYLLPHLVPGTAVLDVGCGPGTITLDLAHRVGPGGHVTGIDAAADVVEAAREAADQAGLVNVTFEVGSAEALGAADGTFDVAHAHQVLQHVGDPVAVLREMGRVVRSGGVVAARDSDYDAMTWFPESRDLDDWLALARRVARGNGGDPDAGRALLSWAMAAGFREVAPSASVWCFATPRDREWWGGLWADRVTTSALAEQALAAGLATPADLDRMATAWHAWAADATAWFAVLHGEVLCRP